MVFSLDLHTNDLTRNGGLFVSSFLERFLDRSDTEGKREPRLWRFVCPCLVVIGTGPSATIDSKHRLGFHYQMTPASGKSSEDNYFSGAAMLSQPSSFF